MDQQRLWAPWRIGYIKGDNASEPNQQPTSLREGAEPSCFLCQAAAKFEDDAAARRQNLVVSIGSQMMVVLNKYPYTNGHLLVSPLRHTGELHNLSSAEHLEGMEMLGHFSQVLAKKINAQGFNIGLNLGRVAGAGVPGHLHWHLVPRWHGDNNFMPTLAGTRMISQSLDAIWQSLAEDAPFEDN